MDDVAGMDKVDMLIGIMANADEDGRQKAGRRLVRIGEPAVPALVDALKSDKPALRESAAIVLALIGEKAIPALTGLMKGEDQDAKLGAMLTLAMIRSEMEDRKDARKEPDHGMAAILESRRMGGENVDADRFVKRPVKNPVKCQGDPTLKLRTERRSG